MSKELNLIEKYQKIEKEIENLSLEVKYAKNELAKKSFEDRMSSLVIDQLKIEKKLAKSDDRSITQTILGNLKQELGMIIDHLNSNSSGHPISRNQGLGIDNFIFGKIIWDIGGAFNASGVPVPNYYFEMDGDFDHTPIKSLLIRKLKELQKMDLEGLNYLKLKKWVSDLKEQIQEFWIEENTKIKVQ